MFDSRHFEMTCNKLSFRVWSELGRTRSIRSCGAILAYKTFPEFKGTFVMKGCISSKEGGGGATSFLTNRIAVFQGLTNPIG